MNDKLICNIISILNNVLLNKNLKIDNNINWNDIFKIAIKHNLLPIIIERVEKDTVDNAVLQQIQNLVITSYYVSVQQNNILERIKEKFNENQIDFMLLKGSTIKKLYPTPEMRTMGDIDILIRQSQYPTVKKCMEDLSFVEGVETDHELHWKHNCVHVELHKRLIPTYNNDFYNYVGDGWKLTDKVADTTEYRLKPEDEFIYLFIHFTKHYRDGGIGIRHLIDLYLYHKKVSLNEKYVFEELKKLNLSTFYKNIKDTFLVWFENKNPNEITYLITKRIFCSGSYGTEQQCDAANALKTYNRNGNVRKAKIKTILREIFLPYSSMKKKYKILEKIPVFLPVFWLVRWCDTIFNKKNNLNRKIRRVNSITSEIIDEYKDELEIVGLNSKF